MSEKLVLVYGYGEEEEKVCGLIRDCGARPRVVRPEEADECIGYLCGFSGYSPREKRPEQEPPEAACMVFSHITRDELDLFLDTIRESGVKTRSLKAMVTDMNKKWSLRYLAGHLKGEQQLMTALWDLKRLRDQTPMPNVLDVPKMTTLFQIDALLSGQREPTLPAILEARKALLDMQG